MTASRGESARYCAAPRVAQATHEPGARSSNPRAIRMASDGSRSSTAGPAVRNQARKYGAAGSSPASTARRRRSRARVAVVVHRLGAVLGGERLVPRGEVGASRQVDRRHRAGPLVPGGLLEGLARRRQFSPSRQQQAQAELRRGDRGAVGGLGAVLGGHRLAERDGAAEDGLGVVGPAGGRQQLGQAVERADELPAEGRRARRGVAHQLLGEHHRSLGQRPGVVGAADRRHHVGQLEQGQRQLLADRRHAGRLGGERFVQLDGAAEPSLGLRQPAGPGGGDQAEAPERLGQLLAIDRRRPGPC